VATVTGPWSSSWWFAPVSLGRVAVLRALAYGLVVVDLLFTTSWVAHHGDVGSALYRPLFLARLLSLPTPTELNVALLQWVLVGLAVAGVATTLAGVRRGSRALGVAVAVLYLWWMFVAMSYGKVDHDRFGFLVLLFVLPTVGHARIGQQDRTAAAGWAVRMAQVAAVATYFLAAWAKVRFGGWGWVNGATLARAVIRRGTWFSDWTLDVPGLLRALQWGILLLELAAPLLLLVRSQRLTNRIVLALYAFHLMTFLALGIVFLPHLVALAAFLPLERLEARRAVALPARSPSG
jgi:hypothetical protein